MLDWTATREVTVMPRKRYTPEEILQHLRTVELDTGKGLAVLDACRKLGITEQTYRAQFLDGELFYTLKEAQIMTERWRRHYNTVRPHGSLGGQPPVPETIQLASWRLTWLVVQQLPGGHFFIRVAFGPRTNDDA